MKKIIFTIALITFMTGIMLTSCRSSVKKVEKAQENVVEANQKLNQALKDSIQQFRTESENRISIYEKDIVEFRARIANEKKDNKSKYEKKLAELDKKNIEMKKKLADYKYEEQAKWEIFKAEYNHDMDQLGQSFKDLTVKNVK